MKREAIARRGAKGRKSDAPMRYGRRSSAAYPKRQAPPLDFRVKEGMEMVNFLVKWSFLLFVFLSVCALCAMAGYRIYMD